MQRYRSVPTIPTMRPPLPKGPPPSSSTAAVGGSNQYGSGVYQQPSPAEYVDGGVLPSNPPRRRSFSKRPPQHRFHSSDIPVVESDEGSITSDALPPPPPIPRRASIAALKRGNSPGEVVVDIQRQASNPEWELNDYVFPREAPSSGAGRGGASAMNPPARRSPTRDGETAVGGRPAAQPQLIPNSQNTNPLRNPHAKVSGVELHAPLPRLQATSERAAERTRDAVYQFMEQLCPERAAAVQKVMDQFAGRETLLMEAITSIFGDEWATHQRSQHTLMAIEAAQDDAKALLPVAYRHSPHDVHTTQYIVSTGASLSNHSSNNAISYDTLDIAAAAPSSSSARQLEQQPPSYRAVTAHPVGINNSRPQTPSSSSTPMASQHMAAPGNPLPPLGGSMPSVTIGEYSVTPSAARPLSLRSESPGPLAPYTGIVDVSDPVAAVMATNSSGGLMTPPLPPELAVNWHPSQLRGGAAYQR